jgi:hypothetical protein
VGLEAPKGVSGEVKRGREGVLSAFGPLGQAQLDGAVPEVVGNPDHFDETLNGFADFYEGLIELIPLLDLGSAIFENNLKEDVLGRTVTPGEYADNTVTIGTTLGGGVILEAVGRIFRKLRHVDDVAGIAPQPTGGGLTTPGSYFGGKTQREAIDCLTKKYGPPTHTHEPTGKTIWFDKDTGRSIVIHNQPGHGGPHVDITRRGGFPARKIPLKEE